LKIFIKLTEVMKKSKNGYQN